MMTQGSDSLGPWAEEQNSLYLAPQHDTAETWASRLPGVIAFDSNTLLCALIQGPLMLKPDQDSAADNARVLQ